MTKKLSSTPHILAIDTSCDDTSVAITQGHTILSNIIASQTQLHAPYGGVFPTVAKQAHKENINQTIKIALKRARVDWQNIQAIAVTKGPGLAPALEVGINKAKELAKTHRLPLIAINHIEAHALSALAKPKQRQLKTTTLNLSQQKSALRQMANKLHITKQITSDLHTTDPKIKDATGYQLPTTQFADQNFDPASRLPALAIVVSGGHTEFIKVVQIGKYERLGTSIDDAAGEVLDKVGRMLNLGYPAGPVIEKFAKKGDALKYQVPLPMTDREDFNMSFSGLKTWARNKIEEIEAQHPLSKQEVYDLSASFQTGVFRHICYKLNKLLQKQQMQEIWLGGGVAANIQLRRMIRETLTTYNKQNQQQENFQKLKLFTPYSQRLCMDNAAMIGIVAYHHFLQQKFVQNIEKLDRSPRLKIDLPTTLKIAA